MKSMRTQDKSGSIWMPKSWRVSQSLRGLRIGAVGRSVREFQKGLRGEIRAGSGALLQRARLELGRSTEKDRSRARFAHGPGHASDDRAGNEGRNINGELTVCEGKQSGSRGI